MLTFDKKPDAIQNSVLSRAQTVIEHWEEMASNGVRREEGQLFGDILNPLATRVHDLLWEMHDNTVLFQVLEEWLINNPALANLVFHHDVKKYVSNKLLAVAAVVLMTKPVDSKHIGASVFEKAHDLNLLISKHLTWNMSLEKTLIAGADYKGPIIGISNYFALQHIVPGMLVAHDLSFLNKKMVIGEDTHIEYFHGEAIVRDHTKPIELHFFAY